MESDINLYCYVRSNPVIYTDPTGLLCKYPPSPPAYGITGACNIYIWAGHGIWTIYEQIGRPPGYRIVEEEDPGAQAFRLAHDVPASNITGCGNYLGFVACQGERLNQMVDERRRIPGFPPIGGGLSSREAPWYISAALNAARVLQDRLCENRRCFEDDGTPQRYECGDKMQRCDSVTIKVVCDDDMRFLLTEGKYRVRYRPNTDPYAEYDVGGLPLPWTMAICDTQEVKNCCE